MGYAATVRNLGVQPAIGPKKVGRAARRLTEPSVSTTMYQLCSPQVSDSLVTLLETAPKCLQWNCMNLSSFLPSVLFLGLNQ